jgi:hypothetical protein
MSDREAAYIMKNAADEMNRASASMSNIVNIQIQMEAMKAANLERAIRGEPPAYGENDFIALARMI